MAPPRGPRPRASAAQRDMFVDFMRKNPKLAKGSYNRTPAGRMQSDAKWKELATLLNAHNDGVAKTGKQWCKFYLDFKSKLKTKVSASNKHHGDTDDSLNSFEDQMLDILRDKFQERSFAEQANPFSQISSSEEYEEDSNDLPNVEQEQITVDTSQSSTSCSTNQVILTPPPDIKTITLLVTKSNEARPSSLLSSSRPETLHVQPPPPASARRVRTILPQTSPPNDLKKPTMRGRRRPRTLGAAPQRPANGSVPTLLEESRRIFAEIETKRVNSEAQQAASIQGLLELVRSYTTESLQIQRQQADAWTRFAVAAERQAEAAERRTWVAERQLEAELENESNFAAERS